DVVGAGVSFLLQAEEGIRDWSVTGVQTCALPIYRIQGRRLAGRRTADVHAVERCGRKVVRFQQKRDASADRGTRDHEDREPNEEIGRASCRERVEGGGGGVAWRKKVECEGRGRSK